MQLFAYGVMPTGKLQLKIKRIDKSIPAPTYQTRGSIGFDMAARIDVAIKPFEIGLVPLNIIVKIPAGYGLFVLPRSSTPKKKGLLIPHGVGVIDRDYCGQNDELMLQVLNFTKKNVTVAKGERIAQGVVVKIATPQLIESDIAAPSSRGGFGSTG